MVILSLLTLSEYVDLRLTSGRPMAGPGDPAWSHQDHGGRNHPVHCRQQPEQPFQFWSRGSLEKVQAHGICSGMVQNSQQCALIGIVVYPIRHNSRSDSCDQIGCSD